MDGEFEIERKWLIDIEALPFKLSSCPLRHITQSYISFNPQVRLRNVDNELFILTRKKAVKGKSSSLVRHETEHQISKEMYEELLRSAIGKTITKTRYFYPVNAGKGQFEIDIFEGEFDGLAVAELEFETLDDAQQFQAPTWLKKDISKDMSYRNVVMAQS